MDARQRRKRLKRPLDAIIIHFDAFYASVVEAETPSLRTRPLAIQQKQIVVTCNYEARRRGLYKLQLIKEAKKICPDVVIVLGEDLTRFRNASKEFCAFLRSFSWNSRCERLGFDEVGAFYGTIRKIPSLGAAILNSPLSRPYCTIILFEARTSPGLANTDMCPKGLDGRDRHGKL
ncbi:hypothetical protein PMIN03_001813 [Paraphaeosphaeria minitans]